MIQNYAGSVFLRRVYLYLTLRWGDGLVEGRVLDKLSRRGKVLSTCDNGRVKPYGNLFLAKRSRTAAPERRKEALMASDDRGVRGFKAIRWLHELMRQQKSVVAFDERTVIIQHNRSSPQFRFVAIRSRKIAD